MRCWKCSKQLTSDVKICPDCNVPTDPDVVDRMLTNPDGVDPHAQIMVGVTIAGRYKIKSEIGRGGMGVVYLAEDSTLGETLALKALPREVSTDPRAVDNMKKEVLIARKLTHPNLIRLHTFDTWEGQPFFTMEYVEGHSLAHFLHDHGGTVSLEKALPILRQIATGLDYAHSLKPPVVHRDIKPLNILMDSDGNARIADFGLSRVIHDSMSHISNATAGAMAYMAPEQMRGKGIGPRSDLFAMACVAYEMLAGHPPFHTGDIQYQVMHEDPEPIANQSYTVNAALLSGLAKNADDRPASGAAFVEMLVAAPAEEVPDEPEIEREEETKSPEPEVKEKKPPVVETVPEVKDDGGDDVEVKPGFNTAKWAGIGGAICFVLIVGVFWSRFNAENKRQMQAKHLQVQVLLNECQTYVQGSDKSYHCYQEVLNLDGGNIAAQAALATAAKVKEAAFAREKAEKSRRDDAQATFNQAVKYANGNGVTQDYVKAVSLYRQAAEQGNSGAMNNLGTMYQHGRGVSKDDGQAVAWYRKGAEEGSAYAMNNLGSMHKNGRGVSQDDGQAVTWYRKGATKGHVSAMFNLAYMYDKGRGVSQDDSQAVKWYRKAAEKGNASAMANLGFMYKNGRGVSQDDGQAVKWYRKAVEKGNAWAMNSLGVMYKNGRGVSQDDGQAVKWYRKGAEKGNMYAMSNLGFMYKNGRGVSQDDGQAVKWYRKSAEKGYATAMTNLGYMYDKGRGVSQDNGQAMAWYRKAAAKGEAYAMNNIGVMYQNGRGVSMNKETAKTWYRKAARLGNKAAKRNLEKLK